MSTAQAIPTTTNPAADEAELFTRQFRFSVADYHRMAESGVFAPDERRFELLFGVVVKKMPENRPHIGSCESLHHEFGRHIPAGYFLSLAHPVAIVPLDSEPEPDAMVLRGTVRDYAGRDRTPADAALVIEVSDSSLRQDRRVKLPLYAAAGVPIYWIVNLVDRILEVYTEPTVKEGRPEYAKTQIIQPDQEVPLVLDGQLVARFPLRDILP